MIRKYIEEALVKMTREVRREVVCDNCNETIREDDGFFEVVTGHSRWGYDSIDSLETRHFCCKKCMNAFLDGYWKFPQVTDKADIRYMIGVGLASTSPDDEVEEVSLSEDGSKRVEKTLEGE